MKTLITLSIIFILLSCHAAIEEEVPQTVTRLPGSLSLPYVELKQYCINGVVYYYGADYSQNGGPVLAPKINHETLLPEKCK